MMNESKYSDSMVMVYDAATGEILHVHRVVSDASAAHPDDAAVERQALAHAAKRRKPLPARLEVLHVPFESLRPRTTYKVDVQKRALIATPR
jgi:hypothetical protein